MKVVLTQRVVNLGEIGDVVAVSDGYFTNFLARKNLAKPADAANLKWAEARRANRVARREEILKNAEKYAAKIAKAKLTFEVKVSENGKLFGAIGEKDILEKLENDLKISLEKKQIRLKNHFKKIGEFSVEIHLAENISENLKIEIVAAK